MEIQSFTEPFSHWVIDGLESVQSALDLYLEIPSASWPGWEARYDNDCERCKLTCRDTGILPSLISFELLSLCNEHFVSGFLRPLVGISDLVSDPFIHGGGLHLTLPGGHLSPHLDYAKHPKLSTLERRVNLVLFLNPFWQEEWGGAFELWDADARQVVKRVYPSPGRAVVWLPDDTAFHGTEKVSAEAPSRATLAVYYLSALRSGVTRSRALFVPNRGM